MLLKHLVDYYEHQILPSKGDASKWEEHPVGYEVCIKADGSVSRLLPLSQPAKKDSKKQVPRKLSVPVWRKRTGIAPNSQFLCDSAEYLLGIVPEKGQAERTEKRFLQAKEEHLCRLDGIQSDAAQALRRFFETWNPNSIADSPVFQPHLEALKKGVNIIFSFRGEYLHEAPAVRSYWNDLPDAWPSEDEEVGLCLVTGKRLPLCRTHPQLKSAGLSGSLISYNDTAFESYGIDGRQGYNASISEYAAKAYGIALDSLLGNEKHMTRLGDTILVSWGEAHIDDCQDVFNDFYAASAAIAQRLEYVRKGVWPEGTELPKTPFYILGLAQQGRGRISVKFFYESTLGEVTKRLEAHYSRIAIQGWKGEPIYPPVYALPRETLPHRKKFRNDKDEPDRTAKVAHGLAEAILEAVLVGANYPESLYRGVLQRIWHDQDAVTPDNQQVENRVTPQRAAIIKAYLMKNKGRKELTMSLDPNCKDAAYVLGRIFAHLEYIQKKADPDVQRTIKNEYLNAASSTPARVFPRLINLSEAHLQKIKQGRSKGIANTLEETLGSLMMLFEAQPIPERFSEEEQGMFILGYYHQKMHQKDADEAHFHDSKNQEEN